MRTAVISILLLLLASQSAAGVVLRGLFTDFDGNPVPDVMVFVDCRENYFFTDSDGLVLTYVEPEHADCAVSASRKGYMVRYCLVTIPGDADTVDYVMKLVHEGEPDRVIPCDHQSRFSNVESCGGLAADECSDDGKITLKFEAEGAVPPSCVFSLSSDEKVLLGTQGYDLENVEKIEFSAKTTSDRLDVTFFALAEDCDAPVGSYPSFDATLTEGFEHYEINLTRWNKSYVQSIWGCAIRDSHGAEAPVIEIKNLNMIFIPPSPSISAGTSQ
jgi:hypothetical protein